VLRASCSTQLFDLDAQYVHFDEQQLQFPPQASSRPQLFIRWYRHPPKNEPRTPEGLERSRRANWKHGHFSREAKAERSRVRAAILALRYLRIMEAPPS